MTQRDGSPLVRAIDSHPEVVLLFDRDSARGQRLVLRMRGRAHVRRRRVVLAAIIARHAARYHLHPLALGGYTRQPRLLAEIPRYYLARSTRSTVVEVTMTRAEFVLAPDPRC
jgi:hypothetical protein